MSRYLFCPTQQGEQSEVLSLQPIFFSPRKGTQFLFWEQGKACPLGNIEHTFDISKDRDVGFFVASEARAAVSPKLLFNQRIPLMLQNTITGLQAGN